MLELVLLYLFHFSCSVVVITHTSMSNNKNIFFFFVANQSFNGKEMSKSNDCFAINSIFALIFICFDWKPSKCVLDSNDWDWNWNQKGNRILDAFEFKLRISNLFVYSALNIDLIFFFPAGNWEHSLHSIS